MEGIIREAYLKLLETMGDNKSERLRSLEQEEDDFYNNLDEKQKKWLADLFDIHASIVAETELAYFKEGFKLGLLLTTELMLN